MFLHLKTLRSVRIESIFVYGGLCMLGCVLAFAGYVLIRTGAESRFRYEIGMDWESAVRLNGPPSSIVDLADAPGNDVRVGSWHEVMGIRQTLHEVSFRNGRAFHRETTPCR